MKEERQDGREGAAERKMAFVQELRGMPVAINTADANEQHYEVPAEYFLKCLGPRLKYSSCLYPEGSSWSSTPLQAAEDAMLELYCKRAELADGQSFLELGCGWGSLCLFLAERFPRSTVVAVSNSNSQREHIMGEARRKGLGNLEVITADLVDFAPEGHGSAAYDRVLSVECFEHMKNYEVLFERIHGWLRPGGKAFLHVFSHREFCYHYEGDDWMTQHFFSGGTMPSHDLFLYFAGRLRVEGHWWVNGRHYAKTLRAWLARMDAAKPALWPLFERVYAAAGARRWWNYWRVFYLACEELFALGGGDEYGVTHILLAKAAP